MARGERTWGAIRKPPGGACQARYSAPDGTRDTAPATFQTKTDVDAWLAAERAKITSGAWLEECEWALLPTVADYARDRTDARVTSSGQPLRPRTKAQYVRVWEPHIETDRIGGLVLDEVMVRDIEAWYAALPADRGRRASTMHSSTLRKHFVRAREAAGRPDLRWHDLRHAGAVMAAQAGATMADLQARLGHSTAAAALRYQHTAQRRDTLIAARLSELAEDARSRTRCR